MENLITKEVKEAAKEKVFRMPIGSFSRLKVNDVISDIVVRVSSSGVWFCYEPNTISKKTIENTICFLGYSEL